MDKGILIIGSLNMDMTMEMQNMPAVGETVLGDAITCSAGGKGANQACAAGMLGNRVKMLGCVGKDEFGRKLRENLSDRGGDISQLKEDSEKETGITSRPTRRSF